MAGESSAWRGALPNFDAKMLQLLEAGGTLLEIPQGLRVYSLSSNKRGSLENRATALAMLGCHD